MIQEIDAIKLTEEFVLAGNPTSADDYPLFPAIAIPVQNKTDETFACPQQHLTYLSELLPSVSKILIIGWQAREAHFLKLLREKLARLAHVMVVGSDDRDAGKTLEFFGDQIRHHVPPYKGLTAQLGFSQFVSTREGEGFFRA